MMLKMRLKMRLKMASYANTCYLSTNLGLPDKGLSNLGLLGKGLSNKYPLPISFMRPHTDMYIYVYCYWYWVSTL
jgi:hypothetical protein